MAQVLTGERSLDAIIVESPYGVNVVPGASGVAELANLPAAAHLQLVQAFSALTSRVDTLIVDTVALTTKSYIDGSSPHSDKMTVQERMRFVEPGLIENQITVNDPEALTEPWRIVRTRLRASGAVPGIVEGGGRPAGYFTGATGTTIYRGDAWPSITSKPPWPDAPAYCEASPFTRTAPDIMFSATPTPALPLTMTLALLFIPAQ